jgi:O-antigen ligase
VAIVGLSLVTLVISGSRFPLVAIGLVLVLGLGRILWRWRYPVLGAAVALAGALLVEGSTLNRVKEAFDPNLPIEQRFDRLVFWQVHWKIFTDHPIAGTGIKAVDAIAEHEYQALGFNGHRYAAHNIYLQQLADTGLIGLAGFLALLAALFVAAKRSGDQSVRLLALAAVVTGLLQNNFRDSEFIYAFWFLLAFALARRAAPAR